MEAISSEFPFESRFLEVNGQRMHYIESGVGAPVLFLHGNPTSSYLWRSIIPHVATRARCIAPDLIGMGRSDKPEIDYRFFSHYEFLSGFIEKMKLKNLTLVVHDWGSGLGFHYACQNPENIRGIVFMEAIYRPMEWSSFPADFRIGFRLLRTPFLGWLIISVMNGFVKQLLPRAIVRDLSKKEMEQYLAPYPTIESRKPVRQWPLEIPLDGKPADVHRAASEYFTWLKATPVPKLFFYASPGGIISEEQAKWIIDHFPNLEAVHVGEGIHYLQEDHPHLIGRELARWMAEFS